MNLFVKKDQSKKMLGGVSFELNARVELNNDEAELIKKYKVDKEGLLQKEVKIPFTECKSRPLEKMT